VAPPPLTAAFDVGRNEPPKECFQFGLWISTMISSRNAETIEV
jgi:hypothetical protein